MVHAQNELTGNPSSTFLCAITERTRGILRYLISTIDVVLLNMMYFLSLQESHYW